MRSTRTMMAVALSLVLGGCATILGGKNQLLTVNSNVQGAEVRMGETLLGVTPLATNIKRGQTGVLRVTAEGYQPYQIALNKKISTLFWVNILSGGSLGSTTDYATGAMYEYEPSTFMASLQAANQSPEELAEWQRREGLRAFVLLNNEAIVSDLASGDGEYLNVLIDFFGVQPEDRPEAVARWRADYESSHTAAEFAAALNAELGAEK